MLYFRSTRNGQTCYTRHDGMEEATVLSLLAELTHTDIVSISEGDFNTFVTAASQI